MRIVAGAWAGRDLQSPRDQRVRPTAETVRSRWLDWMHPDVQGARVLDLFAGTGALGLEAMSRGAASADFVETRPSSLHALKANIGLLRVKARTRVFVKDAIHFADALPAGRYDVAFADPPYESKQLDWLLRIWMAKRFAPVLAVEHARTHVMPAGGQRRDFDDTTAVTIYRAPRLP
ncbi:MAG: RsmD family RNA methyltransferase [Gemmatimonadaceae bacterium]|jgi:16S rRNA (guanine966-N2)-methyltransferase|nr:RsmD family RNA methyltransferase [Gemmatimonadaceae bacterium]